MRAILTGIVALIFTALLVEAARRIAPAIGLVDTPSERKSHQGEVPLVGGIAIFSGLFTLIAVTGGLAEHSYYLMAAAVLVAVGIWDDAKGISPGLRLGFQAFAVLIISFFGGMYLSDLGTLIPMLGKVDLGWVGIPFTVFAGVGIINAFNMSDGVDGLCGTLTLVALAGFGTVAALAGRPQDLMFIVVLSGGLIGFLIFNVRFPGRKQAKAFLGDAGSYLLGLSILYIAMRLSQGPQQAMAPVAALWFCMLPLVDTIGMILRRIRRGRSPFTPDREHIHHVFLLAKFSVTSTWIGLAAVATLGMIFGLTGTLGGMSEAVMLATFLVVGMLYYGMIMRAWKVMRFLSRSINRRTEALVDRRKGADRRQRVELYYVNGVPLDRRSGSDRRRHDRRAENDELPDNVTVLTRQKNTSRPGNRAARIS